ncbi:hypothetical protein [Falsiroseomonas sp.]|uniref:hypothetical protein n=1 Tax=Falsiroseomonas sp. TaxID=2870721 RepID=UPI0027164396|nr:hypothetical protein [Falsiroseomonas sp.]MDO9501058.1 hypothetical protein [Falsiroseomonas sp.]
MHNPARRNAPPSRPETPTPPKPPRRPGARWGLQAPRHRSPARGLVWAVALSAVFWGAVGLLACGLPFQGRAAQAWTAISAAAKLL